MKALVMTREGYHQTSILQLEGYVPQVTMKYFNLILQLLGSNTGWGWEYGWVWDFRMLMFMQMSLANNIIRHGSDVYLGIPDSK